LLQSLAQDAPQNQVDDMISHRLREMFQPSRKTCYDEVLPLPKLEDVADRVRRGRVLLVVSPDSAIPPEVLQEFFGSISQKNNLCVLTGDKTAMASLDKAARQLLAAQKADSRIPKGHGQREDLERKQQAYEQDFNATILSLFDKVLFPIQRPGRPPQLVPKPLDMTRDSTKPFNGEEQIEKTLVSNPPKLFLDVEKDFEAIRDKAQDLLWPENQDEARWTDVVDRYSEQAAMQWLPPKGLDTLNAIACNRGLWEDLKNGYITKKPKKKTTSVQYTPETQPNDAGQVRLRINPQNAGPAPRIYYAEDGPVTESSLQLKEPVLTTKALRVNFLVCDPSGQYETGAPITWSNTLVLRNQKMDRDGQRYVELLVAPRGVIRYTLDGSEPREGTPYSSPIAIGDGEVLLRAFAEEAGLETKADFKFPAKGEQAVPIDPVQPGRLVSRSGRKFDSRTKTFEGLKQATEKAVTFEGVTLTVGQGSQVIQVSVGELAVDAAFIEALLTKVLEKFPPDAPVTLTFRKGHFSSGHDLKDFADKLGIKLQVGDVEQ
ncbi:MAG: chitobiase/beta-hexosaminidase C-terminal domain-containing protein, partial [Nodosilinea sp.]